MFRLYDYSLIGRDGERARYPLWTVESRTTGDWRDRIVQRHPQLFRNERGRMPGYPQVGPGWAELIGLARRAHRESDTQRDGARSHLRGEGEVRHTPASYRPDRRSDGCRRGRRGHCTGGNQERLHMRGVRRGRRSLREGRRPGYPLRPARARRPGRGAPRLGKHPHRACAEGRTHRFLRRYLRPKDAFVDIPALRDRPEGFPPARRVMARPSRTRSAIRAPRKFSSSV